MEVITTFIAGLALLWTAVQEYRIYKICAKCPYFPANANVYVSIKKKK